MGTADLRAGAFQLRKWKFREKIEADFGWVDSLRAKHTFCGNNPACTAEQRCVHQPIDVEFICWEKNDVQKNTVTMLRNVRARALSRSHKCQTTHAHTLTRTRKPYTNIRAEHHHHWDPFSHVRWNRILVTSDEKHRALDARMSR